MDNSHLFAWANGLAGAGFVVLGVDSVAWMAGLGVHMLRGHRDLPWGIRAVIAAGCFSVALIWAGLLLRIAALIAKWAA